MGDPHYKYIKNQEWGLFRDSNTDHFTNLNSPTVFWPSREKEIYVKTLSMLIQSNHQEEK